MGESTEDLRVVDDERRPSLNHDSRLRPDCRHEFQQRPRQSRLTFDRLVGIGDRADEDAASGQASVGFEQGKRVLFDFHPLPPALRFRDIGHKEHCIAVRAPELAANIGVEGEVVGARIPIAAGEDGFGCARLDLTSVIQTQMR